MEHGQILKTDADFDNAILFGIAVSVTQGNRHMASGHMMSQSMLVVKMLDGCFFKDSCKFTVCSAVLKNRTT